VLRDQTVSSTCEIRALEMESKIRSLDFALERGDAGTRGWPLYLNLIQALVRGVRAKPSRRQELHAHDSLHL
jgi:hypothetical protein